VGLRMDFDLGQSIETSGGGITGTINPTFDVSTVARTDTRAHIDEFIGSVTTLPTTSGTPSSATATSFVITGPHGEAVHHQHLQFDGVGWRRDGEPADQ
jgi:hypothetical protein